MTIIPHLYGDIVLNEKQNRLLKDIAKIFASEWRKVEVQNSHWSRGDCVRRYLTEARESIGEVSDLAIYKSLAKEIDSDQGVLRSYAWVSSKFPDKDDRYANVGWSFYRAAAGSKTNAPMDWIQKVQSGEIKTVKQLTAEIAEVDNKEKHYRGDAIKCMVCDKPSSKKNYNLTKGDTPVGNFCSLKCLGLYVLQRL